MANEPLTWTDDLSICVAHDETLDGLVDHVLEAGRRGTPWPDLRRVLTERFALSFEDARLAVDRVQGGRVRRAQGEPTVAVAHASEAWRELVHEASSGDGSTARALVEARAAFRAEENQAAESWREAFDGAARSRAPGQVTTALRLFELGAATMASSCDATIKTRILLKVATALSVSAEARIAELADEPCALEGSQAWVDAVGLAEASRRVAVHLGAIGALELERRAFDLRGRIVTRMMGQCPARVGLAMLDSARCALRQGDRAAATGFCTPVIADFERIVEEWEGESSPPFDEHRIAIEHLVAAIDVLVAVDARHGAEATHAILRHRCVSLLARSE